MPEAIRRTSADDIELLIRALKSERRQGTDDRNGPSIQPFIAANGSMINDGARPEIGDLYEAIDQELRGRPRHVERQGRTWQSDFNTVLADADALLNRAGIDSRTATADEIRAALRGDVSGRVHRQTADDGRPRGSIAFSEDEEGRTRTLITLFKDRNLSTILHETGHLWLEELQADAALANAPDQLKADMAIVRSYLGIEGAAAPTAEQHEKWARTVEAYFLEGKSPSAALSPVLARFKAWMLSIYKTIKGLQVDIDDDVRGVIDRLIAVDVALAEAQAEIHAHAPFASAEQAARRGVTTAEYRDIAEAEVRSLEIAGRNLLAKSTADIRRWRGAGWEAKAEAVRKEVEADIDNQPDLVALHYLRHGTLPGNLAHLRDLPRLRLSREALIEESGSPAIMSAFPKSFQRMVVDKGGVGPAEIARLIGFVDGRSMIGALIKLGREQDSLKQAGDKRSVRAKRIDDEVDRKMLERYGLALIGDALDAEALRDLHNDAGADMLAAEMRALARLAGRKAITYKEATDWAQHEVAEREFGKVSDMSRFTGIEARAAFAAREAWARGDLLGALQHKQEQMYAHALWREVDGARERAAAARRQREDRAAAAGGAIASIPRSAGGSENGPGEWRAAADGMEPPAIAYQKQITGRVGQDYVVDGVKFDGFSDGALIEAKGPGYAKFVTNGEFDEDYKAGEKLLKQAESQTRVANGIPVIWHVADSRAADAMRALFEAKRIKGITVYHTAVVYKRARR